MKNENKKIIISSRISQFSKHVIKKNFNKWNENITHLNSKGSNILFELYTVHQMSYTICITLRSV